MLSWVDFDTVNGEGRILNRKITSRIRTIVKSSEITIQIPSFKFHIEATTDENTDCLRIREFLVTVSGFIEERYRPMSLIETRVKLRDTAYTIPVYLCTDGSIRINLTGDKKDKIPTGTYTLEMTSISFERSSEKMRI